MQPDEARTDRAQFALGSTVIPFSGLAITYDFAPRLSLMLAMEAEILPDEIIDSPIVAQDVVVSSVLSALYKF